MIEEQAGKLEQAIKGYSSYLELIGPNQQIERHLLELVFKQKAAQRNQQVVFLDKACLSKSLLLFERKQYQAALHQINNCLDQAPNDTNTRLLKIQILTTMRNFDETIATLSAWISQEPDNSAWYQALHLLRRATVPTVKIINALSTIHQQHPSALLALLYLADFHTKEGEIDLAHRYHQKALALTDNLELKARIMYQLSIAHYEKGEYTQMLALLNKIEKMEFSYPPAYNLHAYYCATKGKDLETAQQLCSKAHTGDKSNPHFLDTQAVIFYKQKKYEQAEKLLQALHENNKSDSSILMTLAKTQHKQGNEQEALASLSFAQQHARTDYEKKKLATLASRWNKQNA
jgi:tetratricopeptide (TPR) repeat protein